MTKEPVVLTQRPQSLDPAQPQRALSDRLAEAEAISRAGASMLPAGYAGNPGACLLAADFGAKHNLDVLTVVQNVSFIKGKPFLSATLWEQKANENGYSIRTEEMTEQRCRLSIWDDRTGDRLGQYESTIERDAVASNSNWRTNPQQMLFANAMRNVCKFYARPRNGGQMWAVENDEGFVEAAAVEVLEDLAPPANLFGEPDQHAGFPPAATEAELKAMIAAAERKPADILRQYPGKSLADIAADPALLAEVVAQLEGE